MHVRRVVALDAVRLISVSNAALLSQVEIYLVAIPGLVWFAVVLEPLPGRATAGPDERSGCAGSAGRWMTFVGAALCRKRRRAPARGHWVMFAVISTSTLGAMVAAVRRRDQPVRVDGVIVVATLFFALANAVLIIPLGLLPSWLAPASTGFDVLLLGIAVALWDAFDEGQALRADMLRSFVGTAAVAVPSAARSLIGMGAASDGGATALTVLLFTVLAGAIAINVLADPLAGLLDRLAFSVRPGCVPTVLCCAAPSPPYRSGRPARWTIWTTTLSPG